MTLMEFFGCSLVAFSPVLVMFVFTVASHPLKIIVMTCSSFFWLLSLLLSSVVWYAVAPLRGHLAFGMTVSVIFQEAVRVALYYLIKKAESGLQKIALAEKPAAATAADSVAIADATVADAPSGPIAHPAPAAETSPRCRANRIGLTEEAGSSSAGRILDLRTLSYVCGLGFGFMSGAFAMVNLLADVSGPGSVGLAGEHEAFLLLSACLSLLFSCLNICWTIVTFACLETGRLRLLPVVLASHLLCSLLTLLNNHSNALLSLAPTLATLACLAACLLLSLALLGVCIPAFLLSLVSPAWICRRAERRRR